MSQEAISLLLYSRILCIGLGFSSTERLEKLEGEATQACVFFMGRFLIESVTRMVMGRVGFSISSCVSFDKLLTLNNVNVPP